MAKHNAETFLMPRAIARSWCTPPPPVLQHHRSQFDWSRFSFGYSPDSPAGPYTRPYVVLRDGRRTGARAGGERCYRRL